MLLRKPPIWSLQPGLVARPWREHWRAVKAVFPFWEAEGGLVHAVPSFSRWTLGNGAVRRPTLHGPAAAWFPGSSGNELEAEDEPISFAAGEPYTLALLIRWVDTPGTEGIFRSGPSSDGNWLWMTNSRRLWGRHAGVDSPSSGSGPALTAGWHTLVRVWDGRQLRQYVDGIRTSTTAVTATAAWTLHRLGWQFFTNQRLVGTYVPFFGAFGAAWDDAMVARWSANPLGMLWPEMDAAITGDGDGGGTPASRRRPVVIVAAS